MPDTPSELVALETYADLIDPNELPLWVDGEETAPGTVIPWEIDTVAKGHWAMVKLAALEAELRATREQAQSWRAPLQTIDDWEAGEVERIERRMAFFRSHLETYGLTERLADDNRRTIRLPLGEIRTTRRMPRVVVADESAFVDWALASDPDLLKVTYKPIVAAIKTATRFAEADGSPVVHSATGEFVPGLVVEPESLTAKVVINGGRDAAQ